MAQFKLEKTESEKVITELLEDNKRLEAELAAEKAKNAKLEAQIQALIAEIHESGRHVGQLRNSNSYKQM